MKILDNYQEEECGYSGCSSKARTQERGKIRNF